MGNCCRAESSSSSMIWAGEDWSSLLDGGGESKKRVLDDADGKRVSSSSSSCRREIKIKISKKELQKLEERIEAQGLSSLGRVLPLLINKYCPDRHQSGFAKQGGHRSWRPALEIISEAN